MRGPRRDDEEGRLHLGRNAWPDTEGRKSFSAVEAASRVVRAHFLALVLLIGAIRPTAAWDVIFVGGVPIPGDARVATAQDSTPTNHRTFVGAWVGAWNKGTRHVLIVEEIDAAGRAKVVYAWGDNPSANVKSGWRRLDAKVDGNVLSIRSTFTANYEIDDGKLLGKWERGNERAQTEMRKVELDDLRKTDAKVAWPGMEPRPSPNANEGSGPALALAGEETLKTGAYVSSTPAAKGILLHLHGCNGPSFNGWVEAWFKYFEASGFKVYAPNSFAEPRPGQSCNTAPPFPNQVEISAVRVKQTLRVTDLLKRAYPGVPIYVWGHSEGASLSYLLDAQYSGIIASGHVCGHRAMATNKIPREVPVLALIGSEAADLYVSMNIKAGHHGSLAALCKRVMAENPNWKWVQFDDLAHFIPIWHAGVVSEVNGLLKINGRYEGPDASPEASNFSAIELGTKARAKFEREYRDNKGFKVFAIGPGGTYGYSFASSSIQDARLSALYFCNKYLVRNFPTRRCVVYAEGDDVIFGK